VAERLLPPTLQILPEELLFQEEINLNNSDANEILKVSTNATRPSVISPKKSIVKPRPTLVVKINSETAPNDMIETSPSALNEGSPPGGVIEAVHLHSQASEDAYDPHFLDNPDLSTGKHRTVVVFPSFRISIIHFVTKKGLKSELNRRFKQKHTTIPSSLTLSKIRKIKRIILDIAVEKTIELATVAISYVLFEKLVLKNKIVKENRKVIAGVCLLLAAKFIHVPTSKGFFRRLLEEMEKRLGVSIRDILLEEFNIFKELSFAVFLDAAEAVPHYNRLQQTLDLKFSLNPSRKKEFYSIREPN